jgi:quercetin dioxygenase-like cupin family protein
MSQLAHHLDKILRLQDSMLDLVKQTGESVDELCPVTHHFAPGLYAREMLIPAGVTLVGKMHRFDHLCVVLRGRILVATETGTKEIVGPAMFTSPAGVKRAGVAIEDTVWITYHPTEKTDLAQIEADVIVPEAEVLSMVKKEALQ